MKAIWLMCTAAIIAAASMTAAQAGGHFGGGPHSHGTRFGDIWKGLIVQHRVDVVPGTGQVPPPKHR